MGPVLELLDRHSIKVLKDEDGQQLVMSKPPGLSPEQIADFELRRGIRLPSDLRDLLVYSNGLDLFGVQIQPLDEMELFEENLLLTFHNWGNGDFDSISVNPDIEYGNVFFTDHSPDNSTSLDISFYDWIAAVIREIEDKGTVPHPMDYGMRDEEGVYKKVYLK